MSRLRNVTGVDTMHTSHEKSVQPRINRVIRAGKLDALSTEEVCRSRKSIVNVSNEIDYSGDEYSSVEEGAERDLQLLHVASLEINRINDNQNPGEKDEWCEFLEVGNSTQFCQLDTGAYVSVINTTQLRQIATNSPIKKTKKTLVSYSQPARSNQRVTSPFQCDLKTRS